MINIEFDDCGNKTQERTRRVNYSEILFFE